jgi:hypothetical protein
MEYEFQLSISESSPAGHAIRRMAEEENITQAQAAEKLIEAAALLAIPVNSRRLKVEPEYLQQLLSRSAARTEARRTHGDPMAASRPETPDGLIGFLADAPEAAQSIRDLAYERRAGSYGN